MASLLTKIRNFIKQYKNRSFRNSVKEEKGKKYLFQEPIIEKSRKNWNIFRKNGERSSLFSRFIQEKISISEGIRKKQELYIRSIGIFLILACTYILLYSPYFLMSPSKVLIEGLDEGIDISIAYRSIEDLYGKNIFLIDESEIASSLKMYQKNLSLIEIERLYPNGLKILLFGHPILFDVTLSNIPDKKWGMTENGILIPMERMEKDPPLKLIYREDSLNVDMLFDYRELLSASETQIIKKTLDFFGEAWSDLEIEKIEFLAKERELHIILKNKTRILLTIQDFSQNTTSTEEYAHLRKQLIGLKSFVDNSFTRVKDGNFIYIDARILGKIFSCQEKLICEKNLETLYSKITE